VTFSLAVAVVYVVKLIIINKQSYYFSLIFERLPIAITFAQTILLAFETFTALVLFSKVYSKS